MTTSIGAFVWCELMTTDAVAASAFYEAAIGWTAKPAPPPNQSYVLLHVGERPMCGLMNLPTLALENGARPGWMGYIGVDDVDAAVAKVEAAGGVTHRAADDIPAIGRFAVVADPQGAVFMVFKPMGESPPPPLPPGTPGTVGWHELHAAEWQQAFAFYAEQFGWTKAEAIDMGLMGTYQLFATGGFATGGFAVGGMMTRMETVPAPVWIYYFNIDDIDAAVARVQKAGGQIINGPHQVPGGSWIAQGLDPQGAMFAIVGPKQA